MKNKYFTKYFEIFVFKSTIEKIEFVFLSMFKNNWNYTKRNIYDKKRWNDEIKFEEILEFAFRRISPKTCNTLYLMILNYKYKYKLQ